jgi:hypothetical protein
LGLLHRSVLKLDGKLGRIEGGRMLPFFFAGEAGLRISPPADVLADDRGDQQREGFAIPRSRGGGSHDPRYSAAASSRFSVVLRSLDSAIVSKRRSSAA